MTAATSAVVAGIGCRPGCEAAEVVALVRRAEREAGRRAGLLAVPAFRAALPALLSAADEMALPVATVTQDALLAVQDRCPTRSERAAREHGIASVAEGCALAAAGDGGRLILPRIASAAVTCALAEVEEVR
ncbi:cobalamin biosynthesis protein [Roseomonas elaeocarpi]|uniref:Cobalamin biosynthesis protein n=1 Tax=Roseomonas elaeocarpi TaxID=907779 RepID=A0ABV6JUE7_9PROT